ncbi:ATP-dependent Clp protease adapter protein [Corynebacterium ulcerans 809]|uniref:ATP-dependent Clp protease adapter ClpS n=1 Tax=Corynebacterium ulcerans TaxID=65058 RepID=UPI00021854AF|nr:ATP-dependent Clp protease adapter ClpS [Corynebacterium ulcerans]AEG82264.1 ATP-dependent Clp protease adapter protein [Corynebacterium ulcerans 809]
MQVNQEDVTHSLNELPSVVLAPTMDVVVSSPMATPALDEDLSVDVASSENLPWMCIVWDDPVNLMSYVTYVFQTILGYSKRRAIELMMQVHTEGKAVVSSGERDKVEGDVKKLHTAGLWATMQQGG